MEIEFPLLTFLLRQSLFRLRNLIVPSQYMRNDSSLKAVIAESTQLKAVCQTILLISQYSENKLGPDASNLLFIFRIGID